MSHTVDMRLLRRGCADVLRNDADILAWLDLYDGIANAPQGRLTLTQSELAVEWRRQETTVRRLLARMVEAGWIEVTTACRRSTLTLKAPPDFIRAVEASAAALPECLPAKPRARRAPAAKAAASAPAEVSAPVVPVVSIVPAISVAPAAVAVETASASDTAADLEPTPVSIPVPTASFSKGLSDAEKAKFAAAVFPGPEAVREKCRSSRSSRAVPKSSPSQLSLLEPPAPPSPPVMEPRPLSQADVDDAQEKALFETFFEWSNATFGTKEKAAIIRWRTWKKSGFSLMEIAEAVSVTMSVVPMPDEPLNFTNGVLKKMRADAAAPMPPRAPQPPRPVRPQLAPPRPVGLYGAPRLAVCPEVSQIPAGLAGTLNRKAEAAKLQFAPI